MTHTDRRLKSKTGRNGNIHTETQKDTQRHDCILMLGYLGRWLSVLCLLFFIMFSVYFVFPWLVHLCSWVHSVFLVVILVWRRDIGANKQDTYKTKTRTGSNPFITNLILHFHDEALTSEKLLISKVFQSKLCSVFNIISERI